MRLETSGPLRKFVKFVKFRNFINNIVKAFKAITLTQIRAAPGSHLELGTLNCLEFFKLDLLGSWSSRLES